MVFTNGRGRPPVGGPEVGTVSWEEKLFCFAGSNGFYWHGRKFGGWQTEPPEASPENRKRHVSSGRGRRPKGNERIGAYVTYSTEYNCYQTDKRYFWHGTFQGGWKSNPPGTDPAPEDEAKTDPNIVCDSEVDRSVIAARSTKKQKIGIPKGRPPRRRTNGEMIEYNSEKLCWITDRDGGLFWHGTYNGGWKDHPPKK